MIISRTPLTLKLTLLNSMTLSISIINLTLTSSMCQLHLLTPLNLNNSNKYLPKILWWFRILKAELIMMQINKKSKNLTMMTAMSVTSMITAMERKWKSRR
jgi:hypothetical protein